MTRDEAIESLIDIKNEYLANYGEDSIINILIDEYDIQAIDMAIQALEQEPCEDAISRQAVLDLAYTIKTDDYSDNQLLDIVEVDDIKALSTVKPQERTGHWEEVGEEYIQVYDLNGIPSCGDERICSECGFETVFIGEHCSQYKFCPHCGAKMEVEQNG